MKAVLPEEKQTLQEGITLRLSIAFVSWTSSVMTT